MLADAEMSSPGSLGDPWFFYIGPAVIFLSAVFAVLFTVTAPRGRPRRRMRGGPLPGRGPVQGGVIEGSPSQRTRRDPAPSVADHEAMARMEHVRAAEEEARAKEHAEAPGGGAAGPRPKRPGLFGRRRRPGPRRPG